MTVQVCAATVAAAGNARVSRPPDAPSSTSSPRQAAITAGPAAVFLASRSYPQMLAASGTASGGGAATAHGGGQAHAGGGQAGRETDRGGRA